MNQTETEEDTNPCIIAFKLFVHCLPIHEYIINIVKDTIIYYCGQNNTFIFSYSYINHLMPGCKDS